VRRFGRGSKGYFLEGTLFEFENDVVSAQSGDQNLLINTLWLSGSARQRFPAHPGALVHAGSFPQASFADTAQLAKSSALVSRFSDFPGGLGFEKRMQMGLGDGSREN
jgi:hypothetical protein